MIETYINQFEAVGGKGLNTLKVVVKIWGQRSFRRTSEFNSMTTYTELLAQIRDYTETDSAVSTDAICNDFIEYEIRILRR